MSQTFSLVCEETKQKVWVGQGWGKMTTFYSGELEIMARLGEFLRDHEGKSLRLLCDDTHDILTGYIEYGEEQDYINNERGWDKNADTRIGF